LRRYIIIVVTYLKLGVRRLSEVCSRSFNLSKKLIGKQ
jgi:hypothetical protein